MLQLEIVDDAVYAVEISTGSALCRSIINTLAGAEKIDLIDLSFYTTTKDDRSYKRVGTRLNGEDRSNWALSIDEQKALTTEIKDPDTGQVIQRKYNKLLDKLKEMCNPQCNPGAQPRVSLSQATSALDNHFNEPAPAPQVEEQDPDDLPF